MTQTMDVLHCNNFSGCRKLLSLEHTAVVSSCSHIFCVDCATNIFVGSRLVCPACDAVLQDTDDLVVTNLRPSESWKSTILSGLSPAVVLDIANRAFNFHSYQIQQGKAYDDLLIKDLQERTAILEAELASTQHDAAREVDLIKTRFATSQRDLEVERRKTHELLEMHKSNAKSYNKLKGDYDQLKQQRSMFNPNDATMAHTNATAPSPAAVQTRQAFVPVPNPDTRSHSSASHVKYRQGLDTRNENWNTSNGRQQETASTRPFQVVSAQGQGRNGDTATRNGHGSKHRHSTDGIGLNASHQQHVGRSASDGFVSGVTNKGGGGTRSHFASHKQSTGLVHGQQPISHNQHAQHGGVKPRGFRPASFSRGGGSQ